MKSPPKPPDEAARLDSLRSAGVLDTPAEERFDRYTRLASRLFDVPIALVSLVDEERQWFKSRVGLDAEQTSREISFCGHAILTEAPLVVGDAVEDPRFHDNPLVVGDPSIRFYAGAPLKSADGQMLGTLCIIDRKPRTFDAEDLVALTDLAGLVEGELSLLQAASTDLLTGLSNRAGFMSLARRAVMAATARELPLVLLYADLNGFKHINDTYGHAAGDAALKEFAGILLSCFRDSDVVGRIGGDEFCVLAAVRSPMDGDHLVRRLREALEVSNRDADRPFDLRSSIGHKLYDEERHRSVKDLVAEADALMYIDKRGPDPG